jgi:nucleoside-diphosphate-sugar epimerase
VLVVGAGGYIGTNLLKRVRPQAVHGSDSPASSLAAKVSAASVVVHLAARQRGDESEIQRNLAVTKNVVDLMEASQESPKRLIFASSIHAGSQTTFGQTKLQEETYIRQKCNHTTFSIIRIPHTYGAYAKPNYNNVFATFSAAIWKNSEVKVAHPMSSIRMMNVDTVIDTILSECQGLDNRVLSLDPDEDIGLTDLLFDMKRIAMSQPALSMSTAMTDAFLSYR